MNQSRENRILILVVVGIIAFGAFVFFGGGGTSTLETSTSGTVTMADLPPEAITTLDLIDSGGPFPYNKDGSVFQNREGLLPDEATGFYREYTVDTPGSSDRGARRIVVGGESIGYYTSDHYGSFALIADW